MSSMVLPDDHREVCTRILENTRVLVRLGYWSEVEYSNVLEWYENFHTDVEKFIAASILNRIIYRNNKVIKNFTSDFIHFKLPDFLSRKGYYEIGSIKSWKDKLKSISGLSEIPVRFSPVEGDLDGYPGHSGSSLFRLIRREHFHKKYGVTIQNLRDNVIRSAPHVSVLVIFDDLVGTGSQFEKFYEDEQLDSLGLEIVYSPIAAHVDGLDRLSKYRRLSVIPGEVLSEEASFFGSSHVAMNRNIDMDEIRDSYNKIASKAKIPDEYASGKLGQALTYCFADSTPNNNLGALWFESDCWVPLFRR